MTLMKLVNSTRGTVMAERLVMAYGFWRRLRGLLFTNGLAAGQGLLIKPCSGIHTIGMAYSIDIVFVDASGVIVKALAGLKPCRAAVCPGSDYVVELPVGTLARTGTQPGDKVAIV